MSKIWRHTHTQSTDKQIAPFHTEYWCCEPCVQNTICTGTPGDRPSSEEDSLWRQNLNLWMKACRCSRWEESWDLTVLSWHAVQNILPPNESTEHFERFLRADMNRLHSRPMSLAPPKGYKRPRLKWCRCLRTEHLTSPPHVFTPDVSKTKFNVFFLI